MQQVVALWIIEMSHIEQKRIKNITNEIIYKRNRHKTI